MEFDLLIILDAGLQQVIGKMPRAYCHRNGESSLRSVRDLTGTRHKHHAAISAIRDIPIWCLLSCLMDHFLIRGIKALCFVVCMHSCLGSPGWNDQLNCYFIILNLKNWNLRVDSRPILLHTMLRVGKKIRFSVSFFSRDGIL